MKHVRDNLKNLVALWTTVSKPFNGYGSFNGLSYSHIETCQWPNRIWANNKLSSDILQSAKNFITDNQIDLPYIDFEYEGITNKKLIENEGFKLISSLTGMHLPLTKSFEPSTNLNFILVADASQAEIWCDVFNKSFAYSISEDLLVNSLRKINYYIAYKNDVPVGTIMLHQINNVAGIYSLGVPESMRGRGFAKDIMNFILNKSQEHGANKAILQASQQAKSLYERLGFKNDFIMNSYKLKTQ